jgi:hypothetical protein
MTFSAALSTFLKIRRIVVTISILAGAGGGYKFGPAVWHKVQEKTGAKTEAKASTTAGTVIRQGVTTNAAGFKISNCDLGTVSLTNHAETCVLLGPGKDCLLKPNIIDSHNVQLTVTVESMKPNGKIHDLAITQVVTKSGEPFEVAVGDFNFSLTPHVTE